MIYTLIFWVTSCVFTTVSEDGIITGYCPIEGYAVKYYESRELCVEGRDAIRTIPDRVAECVTGRLPSWEKLNADL